MLNSITWDGDCGTQDGEKKACIKTKVKIFIKRSKALVAYFQTKVTCPAHQGFNLQWCLCFIFYWNFIPLFLFTGVRTLSCDVQLPCCIKTVAVTVAWYRVFWIFSHHQMLQCSAICCTHRQDASFLMSLSPACDMVVKSRPVGCQQSYQWAEKQKEQTLQHLVASHWESLHCEIMYQALSVDKNDWLNTKNVKTGIPSASY